MRAGKIGVLALVVVFVGPGVAAADKGKTDDAGKASQKKIKRLKADQPFWAWLADPHGREVAVVLAKVEENRGFARNSNMFSYQGSFHANALKQKHRALADAIGMLRYARKLSPKNKTILRVLGEVADAAGRSSEAIEAFDALLALPKKGDESHATHHAALGAIYARRGEWDKAASHLESGISEGYSPYLTIGLTYALVQMQRGKLDAAIDYLVNLTNSSGYFTQLALAVAYDRNDEESKASEVLETLRKSQTLNSAMSPPWGSDVLPFTPAGDLHYFRALLYEASGHLAEARAEWLAYIRFDPEARYRAKALRHIKDIDATENTRPFNKPKTPGVIGGVLGGAPPPPKSP